jgi:hypothetical protein
MLIARGMSVCYVVYECYNSERCGCFTGLCVLNEVAD